MVKITKTQIEIIIIFLLSLIFGVGMGNIFVGDINLLDEGQFVSWPYQMLNGKLMFKDLFVMYGPLFIYPQYIFFKIFGPTFFTMRIYFFAGSLIALLLVYLICLKLKLKTFTRLIIIALLIFLPGIQLRQAASFMVIVALLYANDGKTNIRYLFVGIVAAIAFLISPEIGIFSMLAVFASVLIDFGFVNTFKKIGFVLIGLITSFYIFFVWAFIEGWFYSYIAETLKVLRLFSGVNAPLGKNFPNLLSLFPGFNLSIIKYLLTADAILYWSYLFLIIVGIYFVVRFILGKLTTRDKKTLPIYIIGLLLYVSVIGRGNIQFIYSYLFILGGVLGEEALRLKNKKLALLFVALLLIIPIRLLTINRVNINKNIESVISYSKFVPVSSRDPLRISLEQKKYFESVINPVNNLTTPHDTIFVMQDEPAFYSLTNRNNASRYDLPYFASSFSSQKELVLELSHKRPKVIIWNKNAWAVDDISNATRLPEVVEYIKAYYNVYLNSNGLIIYKIKTNETN